MNPHDQFNEQEPPEEAWGHGPRFKVKGGNWWGGPAWAGPWAAQAHGHAHFGPGGPPPWAGLGPNMTWFFGGPRRGRGGWGGSRRGHVRSAILALLAERPMHGYEIIGELSERTEGFWRPSPGSIYPALQALGDDGLVTAETDESGKRRYSLTEKGRAAATAVGQAPWEDVTAGVTTDARDLRHAAGQLMRAMAQVAMNGGPHQYQQGVRVLDEARRRLYAILAEGEPEQGAPEGAQQGAPPS